ncbi:MAG TPA: hypothetical protein VKV95_18065 [Terriglobia bacterium]|nr:hypothetical protein [Terriglobia bacterium]
MHLRITRFALPLCAVLVFTPVFSRAQSGGEETKSLADLAREQRAKKDKDGKQPAKVYSNEDMPSHPPDEPSSPSSTKTSAKGKANGDADAKSDASSSVPHDEKYFRGKMDKSRANLASDKARLATLQTEMDDHYRDAVAAGYVVHGHEMVTTNKVNQHFNYDSWVAQGAGLRADIQSEKEMIIADEKAISDLIDQCRHEDCQPGWIR